MSAVALALVLAAAIAHAAWNLFAKRVGGGSAFLWLFTILSAIIYAPLAVTWLVIQRPAFSREAILFIGGSGALHLGYFSLLQRGYRTGDLSLVYPLARGTGPVLATIAAILIFGERPAPIAVAGGVLIGAGVFVIASGPRQTADQGRGSAIGFALLTGLLIAAYTLWDAHAVGALDVPPVLMYWGTSIVMTLLLTPVVLRQRAVVRRHWQQHRREAIGVAVLSPVSYILVLSALRLAPVSYVAPAREVSILFGAVIGSRWLAERDTPRRFAAASCMVAGIVALAIG